MKTIKSIFLMALLVVVAVSCKKSSTTLGGTTSPIGEVGNTFTIYPMGSMPGVEDITAEIIELDGNISVVEFSVELEDEKLEDLAEALAAANPIDFSYSDGVFSGTFEAKITDQGMSIMYDEGELVVVKYNAKEGDAYTLNIDGNLVKNEVVSKSTEDDFMWMGGGFIKVIKVESTGSNLPGIDRVVYYFNHKFGLVGVDLKFIGGTTQAADVVSSAFNF